AIKVNCSAAYLKHEHARCIGPPAIEENVGRLLQEKATRLLTGRLQRIEYGADEAPEAKAHAPSRLRRLPITLVLPSHPQQVAEPECPDSRDVLEGLAAHIPAQAFGQ